MKTRDRLLLSFVALGLTACTPAVFENPNNLPAATAGYTPVFKNDNDSFITATGNCNGSPSVKFSYSSGLVSQQDPDAFLCTNDKYSVKLSIPHDGLSKQTF